MYLSEQQKTIGKENFAEVIGVSRRDFLTGTLAAGVASGAGSARCTSATVAVSAILFALESSVQATREAC